ncbi:NAD(P)-dependent oxidoreductase [Sediminibacillus massiliensis]|uniref:NAD(P)-dependent oxidoreductase n=1 Tax=Sediminibacillus massiliensis TaxID=1926277 RepID=UPI0009884EA7|nr:NAD(P)-dependent oxidoreductase [Sediminibacillus massiliensis]
MKVGVIGASGKAGSLIAKEAVDRGHEVTGIVRNAFKLKTKYMEVLEKDLFDLTASDLTEFDIVVDAFAPSTGQENLFLEAGTLLIKALEQSSTRLIVVGGAGSLFIDETKETRLLETREFPDFLRPTAEQQLETLKMLEQTKNLNWTYISPAVSFEANGRRTGFYKKGTDYVIGNKRGKSHISYADYAIAVIDEIENEEHNKERFTVVGEE